MSHPPASSRVITRAEIISDVQMFFRNNFKTLLFNKIINLLNSNNETNK